MSNLIKSSYVRPKGGIQPLDRFYVRAGLSAPLPTGDGEAGEALLPQPTLDEATDRLRRQVLDDARSVADDTIADAARKSAEVLDQAQRELDEWWHARRADDDRLVEEVRAAAYEAGFQSGRDEAEKQLREEWEQRIQEASSILESSYAMREQIIQEAEPFLIELSCAIAEKLVGRQLTLEPDWAAELVKKALSRRKEHGVIVLCVAPAQLAAVQAARDELELSIDSQAELQILPDASVKDHGCVIRSAFGSIDARIDTQLAEIKRELVQLAQQRESQEAAS
ncbi:FliH/SctL family protein [Paenibacillus albicereus]|uniref:FliH/SctL family protein n=1 Tax=Paenibacillus albicereus TaxID=2726185 RepID=UPI001F2363DC|nr:FliH/SctL family protein [Paenibacillus albicereus]